jgi:hypothetical protein
VTSVTINSWRRDVQYHSRRWLAAACVMLALAACDDDPNEPTERLTLVGCPANVDVNAPLTLTFSTPLNPATVAPGAIVVSSAETGLEIPGSFSLNGAGGTSITFTPADPFRFDERVRLRVQNLRSAATNTPIEVTLCEFTTPLPPITQLWWRELPNAGGNLLVGAAITGDESGFVLSNTGILSRGGAFDRDFEVRYQEPRFVAGFDIDFVSPTRGFATFSEFRRSRTVLVETTTGGARFDSVASVLLDNVTRIQFDTTGRAGTNTPFNAMGGGGTYQTSFYRYLTSTRTFRAVKFDFASSDPNASGQVQDLDIHPTDTARVAAVTAGVRVPPIDVFGWLWITTNGGASWRQVQGSKAPNLVLTYWGTAVRPNGDVWVTGGNGYVARFANPFATTGVVTPTRVPLPGIVSIDTLNPDALVITDIQFAPDNPNLGWSVGARLVGQENGVPRYEGLIFETRDGGTTWTRQGVSGAPNYGAEIPRLNRLEVRSSTSVWIVGDGGTVLRYAPLSAGTPSTLASTP